MDVGMAWVVFWTLIISMIVLLLGAEGWESFLMGGIIGRVVSGSSLESAQMG